MYLLTDGFDQIANFDDVITRFGLAIRS